MMQHGQAYCTMAATYEYLLRGFLRDLHGTTLEARGGQEELRNPGLTLATGTGASTEDSLKTGGCVSR
jgi:hypothetical protein